MKRKRKSRESKRTSLFLKYFRVTLAIITVTTVSMAFVFLLFIANYWTGTNVDILMYNTSNVAATVEGLFASGKAMDDSASSNLVMCNSLNMVSQSTGADVFMTDLGGKIILCKDLLDENMEVINQGECKIHEGYVLPERIVKETTKDGYYTMDVLDGLYDALNVVVGCTIEYYGSDIGYIYAVTPVSSGLGPYISEMLKLFVGAAVISFVVALILIYLFSYTLTKPMREMSHITTLYANGDFNQRIEIKGNDELTDLASSLNTMAESLAVLEDSRRSFVANVSHELKTPMTTIRGFIDGILDGTIPPDKEKQYLKRVSNEVKRLSTLVVTMLTLSKIEAGEEKLKLAETELNQLIFNALLSFESTIEQTGIRIEGFENMPQVKVMADDNMLFQVAYNLFDNAVKFTNPGGMIKVELFDEQDRVVVSISNTGVGIPENEINRVFERFYKVDKSRSEHVKGVGLGLNIVKNITELHGGGVSVSSIPGEITTFSFWIPKKYDTE